MSNTGGGGGGQPINVNIDLKDVTQQLEDLNTQMTNLLNTFRTFGQQQYQLSQGFSNVASNTQTSALGATDAVKTFFSSLGGNRPGGTALGGLLNYGLESGLVQDILSFPLRFMQSNISQNRQTVANVTGGLAGQAFATGVPFMGQNNIFRGLNYFTGNYAGMPIGTPDEIIQLLNIARQSGAMIDMNQLQAAGPSGLGGAFNPRGAGFMQAVSQVQQMYPGTPLGTLATTVGGYAGNVQAQQQSAYLTGGAFSILGTGGRMKTITEWAEAILRWLENQRPGPDRGKPFNYGELLSQQFPGSNIDSWLAMNGVPPDMREVWWNYALAKANMTGTTGGTTPLASPLDYQTRVQGLGSTVRERLSTTGFMSRGQFQLANTMSGRYLNREEANRSFAAAMSAALPRVIGAAAGGPFLGALQFMPDVMEEFMTSLMERMGFLGSLFSGIMGYGSLAATNLPAGMDLTTASLEDLLKNTDIATLFENILGPTGALFGGLPTQLTDLGAQLAQFLKDQFDIEFGDVGDAVGDWGPMGATNTNSLHPSMKSKVDAMMRANPKLKLRSGRRDEVLQQQLRAKGHTRVSGKSSAHTRGLAADLGPSSQYGWIVANARRFGLTSGVGEGEPWHVGLGDVGDAYTEAAFGVSTAPESLGGLAQLFSLFAGGITGAEGIGAAMPGLFNLMFGIAGTKAFAGQDKEKIEAGVAYDPDFANRLATAMQYQTGGKFGFSTAESEQFWADFIAKYGTAAASDKTKVTSGGATLAEAIMAIGQDPGTLSNGAMVAKLAQYVGYQGSGLRDIVAIARRESTWDPSAFNDNAETQDLSYGLTQLNMRGALGPERREAWGLTANEELFDPIVNLRSAYQLSNSGTDFYHWVGYRPGANNLDQYYAETDAAIAEAGITMGDTNPSPYSTMGATRIGGTTVQFHNSFTINGSNGNGGIDIERTVRLMADRLEGEMQRRLARYN